MPDAIDHGLVVAQKHGIERSPKWPATQEAYRKAHPYCAACGSAEKIQIHHVYPFHEVVAVGRPDLELDWRNLISLCENPGMDCHLKVGHLGFFQSYNPSVREMSDARLLGVVFTAPGHPKPMSEWNLLDKAKFRMALRMAYGKAPKAVAQ